MWGLPLRAAHWEDVCESSGTGSTQFRVKSPRPCGREIGAFLKQAVSSHVLVWGLGTSHFIQKFYGSRQKLKWFLYSCDKPGYEGDPRQMGHGGEFWQNVVHWRREWQTTSIFLPWEPHKQYEKAKRYDTERWLQLVEGKTEFSLCCAFVFWREMHSSLHPQFKHPFIKWCRIWFLFMDL